MFLYGGLEQEEYQQIKDDIAEYNRRCLMVTNVLTLGLMITSVIASLFLFALDSFLTMLYTGYLFADIVMLTAATFALKQDRRMITPFVWICIAVLYSYAVMTTVINPASQATTMMVCLAVIPVILALRPAESVPLTIAMAVFFDLLTMQIKQPAIWHIDLWNSTVFCVVGIVAGTEITLIKFRSLSLARKNRYLFESDLLTGVRSRNSYEEICDE